LSEDKDSVTYALPDHTFQNNHFVVIKRKAPVVTPATASQPVKLGTARTSITVYRGEVDDAGTPSLAKTIVKLEFSMPQDNVSVEDACFETLKAFMFTPDLVTNLNNGILPLADTL
jgi:hypothetical protein